MDILDIFYNHIIKEAIYGRIDSFFFYNIIFNTVIEEENIRYEAKTNYKDLIIPTLHIKDKKSFDKLLVIYVNKCLNFYDDSNFPTEVISGEYYDEDNKISKEKTILALLFANAGIEDFANPVGYLQKRIDFLENNQQSKTYLGYSNILDADIQIDISKDKLNNETPYQFIITLISNSQEKYELPRLKFGISDNKAYVLAIQNSNKIKTKFSQRINRKLYKVGEGFSKEIDNFDIYEEGNLSDVTPSFLVVANIFITYMSCLGINDLVISSILLARWNAKSIANQIKSKNDQNLYNSYYQRQLEIQANLTEKFLRTFLRLNYHCDNLTIVSYPNEQSFDLLMTNNGILHSNNNLLNETAFMTSSAVFKTKNNKIIK